MAGLFGLDSRCGSNIVMYNIVPAPVHIQVANLRWWLTGCHSIWYNIVSNLIQITNLWCWLTGFYRISYNITFMPDLIDCSMSWLTV